MPERWAARGLAGFVLAVLLALAGAPAASAQTDQAPLEPSEDPEGRWGGSGFAAPLEGAVLTEPEVEVAGRFVYRKRVPGQRITAAAIQIAPDGFEPAPTCEVPPPQPLAGNPPQSSDYDMRRPATLDFHVPDLRVSCNGRYLVHATAQLDDGTRWSMQVRFGVAVAPPTVEEVTAELDAEARAATVTFTPLALEAQPPDAAGYLVERAGPDDEDFVEVATVPEGEEPRVVDDLGAAEAGRYTYRVRALRPGVDEPVASDPATSPTADIQLEGPPTSPTTVADRGDGEPGSKVNTRGGSIRVPSRATATRRRSSPSRQGPPTTLDTGFEESLDYGDGEAAQELADEPVAGGQSVVRDEAESVDLAVPAAGALVMLGWAGHIVYLNRLAKQL